MPEDDQHVRKQFALQNKLYVCVFAGRGDEETLADSQQPVQTFPRDADEDAQRVSAFFCSLYKTQRAEETYGECVF